MSVQDLDEIPKREAVRAIKHCTWEVKPGKHDCVALEGSFFYYAFSWNAGRPVLHTCHVGSSSHRTIAPLVTVDFALLWLCTGWAWKPASQHLCSRKAYVAGVWNAGPRVVKWLGNCTSDGEASNNDMRYHANCSLILKDSSWHCTDCFATIAQVRKKIGSFNHWELNR